MRRLTRLITLPLAAALLVVALPDPAGAAVTGTVERGLLTAQSYLRYDFPIPSSGGADGPCPGDPVDEPALTIEASSTAAEVTAVQIQSRFAFPPGSSGSWYVLALELDELDELNHAGTVTEIATDRYLVHDLGVAFEFTITELPDAEDPTPDCTPGSTVCEGSFGLVGEATYEGDMPPTQGEMILNAWTPYDGLIEMGACASFAFVIFDGGEITLGAHPDYPFDYGMKLLVED